MSFDKDLLELEFLIYSAHKTATQTIVNSFRFNGLNALHCHKVGTYHLELDDFAEFLNRYELRNAKKLKLISVFRDPMDRLISSFFQWHGTRQIQLKNVECEADTLIMKEPISKLQEIFVHEYCEDPKYPIFESIDVICEQLSIHSSDLVFSEDSAVGVNQLKACSLYLFRFDLLTQDFSDLLSGIAGKKIRMLEKNISNAKFYAIQYRQFKESLRVPVNTIERIYDSRKSLINVFYKGRYEEILHKAILKFGA
jgi:hypothetical protein